MLGASGYIANNLEAETLGDRLGDALAEALVDTLADTLAPRGWKQDQVNILFARKPWPTQINVNGSFEN